MLFDRAYRGQPLPKSFRTLAPGLHIAYALKLENDFLIGGRVWRVGDRVVSKGFVAEILELSHEGMPRSVAFHFEQSLDSENMVWLYLDWRRHAHLPFILPKSGETTELLGPTGWPGRASR